MLNHKSGNINSSERNKNSAVPWSRSLRLRLMVSPLIMELLLVIFIASLVTYMNHRRIDREYSDKGASAARIAACLVNGETVDRYLTTRKRDDEYRNMMVHLRTIQQESNLQNLYVVRVTEKGQVFVFDPAGKTPFSLGEAVPWTDILGKGHDEYKDALYRGERVKPLITKSKFGLLLSVYEPIPRADGSVAGYAGADILMDQIMAERMSLYIVSGIVAVAVFALTGALNVFISQRYVLAPINVLVGKTGSFLRDKNVSPEETAGGAADFRLRASLKYPDELGVLERSIIEMERRVRAEISARLKTEEAHGAEIQKQLNILKNIMNGIEAFICVTVPETGELLFLDDDIRKLYGIAEDYAGRHCYKLLNGLEERCDFCPYRQLENAPDQAIVWTQTHGDRTYRKTALLIDWPGGVKAHLEYGVDVTKEFQIQEMLHNILYTMDSLIMVTDMETDEILFMNQKDMAAFGMDETAVGEKCWRRIQPGMEKRCDFCRKNQLSENPGKPVIWEHYNEVSQKDLILIDRVIDWPDGRKVHMQQAHDVSDIRQVQAEAEYQARMTKTLNDTAIMLLSQNEETFADTMTKGVGLIVDMIRLDRLTVWRNTSKADGLHSSQIYRWDRTSGGTTEPTESFRDILFSELTPRWEERLESNEVINGPVRLLPTPEAAMLQSFGCISVFIAPIRINDALWGFALFEDRVKERAFTESETNILRPTSLMMAYAANRNEEALRILEANERAMMMLDATPLGCLIIGKNIVTIDCNEAAVKLFGFRSKKETIEKWNLEFCSPEYQPDGQRSTDKGHMLMKKAFEEGSCVFEWMHQLPDGTQIPTEATLKRVKYEDEDVVIGYIRDLRSIKRLETEAAMIYFDGLTGIHNRRYFDENLVRVIKSLSRSGGTLSLMMLDIDFFKKYNDAYGHIEGDNCLKTIAATLENTVTRADDFVTRYGGEEFAVVLPNTEEDGARLIADRLLDNIRRCNMPHAASEAAGHVTISIGITTGKAAYTSDGSDYLRRADEALYASKQNGRDRYTFLKNVTP